jgi:dipeptidyl aminopeptidase/acylaminoacyl peptidase
MSRFTARFLASGALLAGASPAFAQATPRAEGAPHDIALSDTFTLDNLAGFAVDATGERVAFVRSRWNRTTDRAERDLAWLDTRTRAVSSLTGNQGDEATTDEHSPRFLLDGTVAYVVERAGEAQVWRVDPATRVREQVTRAASGVKLWDFAADERYLLFTTDDTARHVDDLAGVRDRYSALTYGHSPRAVSTIWQLDRATNRVEQVHAPAAYLYELDVSPDGRYVAMLTMPDDELLWKEGWSQLRILDRASWTPDGAPVVLTPPDALWRAQAPSPWGWLGGLAWSSDSRALTVSVDFDGYPGETYAIELADNQPLIWPVPRPSEVHPLEGSVTWVPGRRELCQRVADHARERILCVDGVRGGTSGRTRLFPEGDVVVREFHLSGDGRDVVADVATPTALPELYRLPARGQALPARLTDLNPHAASWRWPTLQLVSWTAPDGTPVEGTLELPAGWAPEQGPLPFLVDIHGGPTSHTSFARRLRWSGDAAYAARGWAVLRPNYRGSIGYGDRFLTDLIGKECEIEHADITAGVDAMLAKGIGDPARMAVMGWSNGGYLTACAITKDARYKAGIVGAGVVDQVLQWVTEDTPGHVLNFMGGKLPWEPGDAYERASPLLQADRIVAATLIHVGEKDPRVPAVHAQALFRALDVYRRHPAELVVYPGAGHGLRKLSQIEAKMAWDVAWLDRWVLGNP